MVTAIAILSGVCLLLVLAVVALAAALSMAVAQINDMDAVKLPSIKWDYTVKDGWVNAEVEEDVE
jgi:hypothetical protein